jgi:hypothetical protein
MKPIRTSRFDIAGNGFFRVFRFNLLNSIVPLGVSGRGTGLKAGLVLLFLHWFGRPLFYILIRYERYLHRFYLKFKKNG